MKISNSSTPTWDSLIMRASFPIVRVYNNKFYAKPIKALALVSKAELILETKRMNHDVTSRVDDCLANTSRIFTLINKDANHIATTELSFKNGIWQHELTRGISNTIPDKEILNVAKALATLYQRKACEELVAES